MLLDSFDDKYRNSNLSDKQKLSLTINLIEYVVGEKPFLDPNLTIKDLAQQFNTNKAYLSQVINENLKMNFSTFINKYRIKEAKRILEANRDKKILIEEVARQAGFNNRMAFYNSFKRFTGMTPYEYAKAVRNSDRIS